MEANCNLISDFVQLSCTHSSRVFFSPFSDSLGKELIKVGVLLPTILRGVLPHTTGFNLTQQSLLPFSHTILFNLAVIGRPVCCRSVKMVTTATLYCLQLFVVYTGSADRPHQLPSKELPPGRLARFIGRRGQIRAASRSVILKRLITLYICWDSKRETTCWRVCPVINIGHSFPINMNMKLVTIVDFRCVDRKSSVGIATRRARRSGDRIPVGARFSAPFHGPGAHPASYTMGTEFFPVVKWPERGLDQPPHLAPRLKKEYSYISTPPLGLRGLFQGEVCFYLFSRFQMFEGSRENIFVGTTVTNMLMVLIFVVIAGKFKVYRIFIEFLPKRPQIIKIMNFIYMGPCIVNRI